MWISCLPCECVAALDARLPANESLMTTRARGVLVSGALASCRCVWRYPCRRQCAAEHSSLTAPFPAGIALPTPCSPPCPMLSRHAETSAGTPKHTVRLPLPPPCTLGSPRHRRPPAGLEKREKATDRSSDVQVATTKPPKPRVMLTMRADLNPMTSNLVEGRGATPPGGGSLRSHPGAAWGPLQCPRHDAWASPNKCKVLLGET